MFPEIPSDLLTISEAAKKCKVTKVTIHNWAKQGVIKKYRLQGRTLIKLSELEKNFK
jgi:excisionase family DNA binding protein